MQFASSDIANENVNPDNPVDPEYALSREESDFSFWDE